MAKNSILLAALSSPELKNYSEQERNQALDALLGVSFEEPELFRKAVVQQGDFWHSISEEVSPVPDVVWQKWAPSAFDSTLPSEDHLQNDTFLDSNAEDGFQKIQQAAALQRVLLSLKAADPDILGGIIYANNIRECQRFLQTVSPSLVTNPSWAGHPEQLIDAAALSAIKTQAVKEIFIKELEQEELKGDDLAARQQLLRLATDDFVTGCFEKYQNLLLLIELNEDDFNLARQVMQKRYLQVALARYTDTLAPVVKAAAESNLDQTKTELAKIFPGDENCINQVVTAEALGSIHTSLLDHQKQRVSAKIAHMSLRELANCDAVTSLKTLAKELGPDAEYCNNAELVEFRKVIRLRRFELQLDSVSPRGAVAHAVLTKVFKNLEPEQQQQLLSSPANWSHVIQAEAPDVLSHYLGAIGEEELSAIQNENQVNKRFNAIQNAEVRKILNSVRPPVYLMSGAETQLNNLLQASPALLDVNSYKTLIDNIASVLDLSNPAVSYYRVFGLNDQGTAFIEEAAFNSIRSQMSFNKLLFDEKGMTESVANKEALDVFLRMAKPFKITGQEAVELYELLYRSKNVDQFITDALECFQGKRDHLAILEKELRKEFTPAVYQSIRSHKTTERLKGLQTEETLARMKEEFRELRESRRSLPNYTKELAALANMRLSDLANPVFYEKAKSMEAEFQQLSDDLGVLISTLLRHQAVLKGYSDNLHMSGRVDAKAVRADARISKEMKKIEDLITWYTQARDRLSGEQGIIPAIQASASPYYVYKADGVKSEIIYKDKDGQLKSRDPSVGDAQAGENSLSTQAYDELQGFKLGERPSVGEKRNYSIEYQNRSSGLKSESEITYEVLDRNAYPVTVKDGTFKHEQPMKVTITQQPRAIREDGKFPSKKEQKEAEIDTVMHAAKIALAALGSPPSKDRPIVVRGNELVASRLWTALIILGETDPNMKFGPEAIAIHPSSSFKLETQKTKIFGAFSRYTENSLYETDFKEVRQNIMQTAADLRQLNNLRFDQKGVKGMKRQADHLEEAVAVSRKSRKEINELREAEGKKAAEEGVTQPKLR